MISPKEYYVPQEVFDRDGPFEEFKQDGAFVSVELKDGRIIEGILLLYPNRIIAMEGQSELPFNPSEIIKAFQTNKDLKRRSSSDWVFWLDK